jgi:hypothetical protein
MGMRSSLAVCLMIICHLGASPARAETAVDGRIARIVYTFASGGSWGFHLAHMKDNGYCVRFGNPGRLTLKIIDRVADICFDTVPGSVERTRESRSQAFDVREKGKRITVVKYHSGSIAAGGRDITLDIATCNRIEGEEQEADCRSNRYVVHIDGGTCTAEIFLAPPPPPKRIRIATVTCEHYPAE